MDLFFFISPLPCMTTFILQSFIIKKTSGLTKQVLLFIDVGQSHSSGMPDHTNV